MTRLSVVIRPPADVVALLEALPRPPVAGLTWALPEQFVARLRPLGHVADHLVEPLTTALENALDGAPAVECVLGPATERPSGQWMRVPVAGLDELSAVVFEATEGIVPVTHPQPFHGHVVLARGRVPAGLAGEPVCARWTARAVHLIADRSSPRGPRLDDLAEFPLDAA